MHSAQLKVLYTAIVYHKYKLLRAGLQNMLFFVFFVAVYVHLIIHRIPLLFRMEIFGRPAASKPPYAKYRFDVVLSLACQLYIILVVYTQLYILGATATIRF